MKRLMNILKHLPLLALMLICGIGATSRMHAAFLFQQVPQEISFNQYKGEVLDAEDKKPLVFASISIEDSNISDHQ